MSDAYDKNNNEDGFFSHIILLMLPAGIKLLVIQWNWVLFFFLHDITEKKLLKYYNMLNFRFNQETYIGL